MGRKRLLTVLAAVVAAVGLQVGPAAALDLGLPGVGKVTLDTSDGGLKAGIELDAGLDEALKLDPKVEVGVAPSGPSLEVEGGISSGGERKLDLGDVTAPVTEAVDKVAETAKGSAPLPGSDEKDGGSAENGGDQVVNPSKGSSGSNESGDGDNGNDEGDEVDDAVTTAGRTRSLTPEREAQLEALRAIRKQDAATTSNAAVRGPLVSDIDFAPRGTAEGLGPVAGFAAPEVAPGVSAEAPQVASTPATLAASPLDRSLSDVPVSLQLLAGLLVAGTAFAWNAVRREQLAAVAARDTARRARA